MKMTIVIGFVFVAVAFMSVSATIINIPDDYETIQEGIDASTDGDSVLVQPGTYMENINFNGHNIVLGSLFLTTGETTYIAETIIDGNQSGSVVTFETGEDSTATIMGFTLRNGDATSGGGIFCRHTSPTISYNKITLNSAEEFGGGICLFQNSNPKINNNVIDSNFAILVGGGILIDDFSHPIISQSTISGNSAQSGAGAYCIWHSNPSFINSIFTRNYAAVAGGAIYISVSDPIIINTICWADSAGYFDNEIYIASGNPAITYCDIEGGREGEGNIDCDPLFCYPDTGDYYLSENSCCVGAGEDGADIGAYGVGCPAIGCDYLVGDCNHNGNPLEIGDVVTMIGMYRGTAETPYTCDCPPHGYDFAPEADPNGNCVAFELGDVVTEIGAYRGSDTASGCADCPGSLRLVPGEDAPLVTPGLKAKAKKITSASQ